MKTTPVTTRTLYLAFGLLIGGALGSIAMATLPQFARTAVTPVAVGSSLCSVVLLNGILRRGR